MENDKELKNILGQWGIEKTSENFTSKTMQSIVSLHEQQSSIQLVVYGGLRRLFILFLIVVLLSLAVACIFMPPVSIPAEFNVFIAYWSNKTIYNVLSFTASLWVLLFINQAYEKKKLSDRKDEHYAAQ